MTRLISILSIAALAVGLVVGSVHAGSMEDVAKRGILRVGIAEEDFLPWLARETGGGRMGYEIDVARGVARDLDVQLLLVERPFDSLLRSLRLGEVDVVISAISVTPERAREVIFTSSYGETEFTVVVDKTSLPEGAEENAYDITGMKIGVAAGTVAEDAAAAEFELSEIVRFGDHGDLRDAFVNGEINGVVVPTPYPEFIVARDPERFAAETEPITKTVQAMAVRSESLRFANFLNAWIMVKTADGTLAELNGYWFKSLDWLSRLEGYDATEVDDASDPAPENAGEEGSAVSSEPAQ